MPREYAGFNASAELHTYGIGHQNGTRPGTLDFEPDWALAAEAFDLRFEGLDPVGEPLPIDAYLDELVAAAAENPVIIVQAATGAGKSTKFPPALLKSFEEVIVSQPLRLGASGVWGRIREEYMQRRYTEGLGGAELASYQTAVRREGPEDARIKLLTDGLLLNRMLHNDISTGRSVLLLDEVHERNYNIDILLAVCKERLAKDPNFRVIIVSATMDIERLADYFADGTNKLPPIFEIPGRGYNLEWREAPESTVSEEVVKNIKSCVDDVGNVIPGKIATLAFLPGKGEINDVRKELLRQIPTNLLSKVIIIPLHARMSRASQQKALDEYPGLIKVVLATNAASNSITVTDVKYVINCGWVRRGGVDEEGSVGLPLVPLSITEIVQNGGRAGRVCDGFAVTTRLNKKTDYVKMEDRDEFPPPEVMRSLADRNQLRVKAIGRDLLTFDMLDRPPKVLVDLANANLQMLGALDEDFNITPMGRKMNNYPLEPPMARIMIEGERYNQDVRRYLAAITAVHEAGDLRYFAPNADKRWQELKVDESSDLLARLDIFIASQTMTKQEMANRDLDINNLERAREQYRKIAKLAGTTADRLKPPNEAEQEDIKTCITAGYLPFIYKKEGGTYVHAFRKEMPTPRVIAKRSVVTSQPQLLMGSPRTVVGFKGEIIQEIEHVTPLNIMRLGRVATNQVIWKSVGFVKREGKILDKQRMLLFGLLDLGLEQEVIPEPSLGLREAIVDIAIKSPGYAQKELRKIKKELEQLAKIAKDHVPQISSQYFEALVHMAATDGITNPAEIEDNLSLMMADPDRKLRLDDFVPAERRAQIRQDALMSIEVDGVFIRLDYSKGQPYAKSYREADIQKLTDEVFLPDGRHILFSRRNDSKKYPLHALQEKLKSNR